jgi:dipeptidase E
VPGGDLSEQGWRGDLGHGSTVWMQELDPAKPLRHAMHVDVSVGVAADEFWPAGWSRRHEHSRPGGVLKLLLTSAGVKNPSIQAALVDLLGKPIAESSALCIPTAMYGHPNVGPGEGVWRFISGNSGNPMTELGWKSVGVLELTALPSLDEDQWVPKVREADVLLVAGGDVLYLCYWMRESGLADLLPSLSETVWVGLSSGSMVLTPQVGEDFIQWRPPGGDDSTLGLVDFSICPHVNGEGQPGNTMAEAESWAAGIKGPAYAVDDETAFKVVDGEVEVVSEGHWTLLS